MNFQEKLLETTADLRARAFSFANAALPKARARITARVDVLKHSFETLSAARRGLKKVARVHTARFVKENSAIAAKAGRDVSALARTAYVTLTQGAVTPPARRTSQATRARKSSAKRARTAAKAA
jgi:hypothetical protein